MLGKKDKKVFKIMKIPKKDVKKFLNWIKSKRLLQNKSL